MSDNHHSTVSYEAEDIQVGPVVIASIALLIFTIVVMVFVSLGLSLLDVGSAVTDSHQEESHLTLIPEPIPGPRLQPNPVDNRLPMEDMILLREHEDSLLLDYEWINQDLEQVRIPVERAIEVLADEGLPTVSE